ncbi:alpha/beta hydrolase [Rhizobium laguerreae]|uniref:alpha/beta fold hydrolase n=1 Tax=Rhizobium TaxID=379 RepID=UPI0014790876|nr:MULTISPECIES: alpha/beta hydrolase [Rhizobium]MBY5370529.1 alpha/beta hydrolase [Rhizobium leguminosarum]NNH46104.1 alpha/beta hydrolase [Rhizobium laguerreae]
MTLENATNTETKYADLDGRRIAYRLIGQGTPLVLAVRFRGTLDAWDPLFLDELAKDFTVITFDYTGLGASTGAPTYDRASLAKDAKDLIDFLGYKKVVMGGWSLGGVVAQVFSLAYPELVSHLVLIGTAPPGHSKISGDPLFMKTAMKPVNDLADEAILFFEPESSRSKEAARLSHERIAARKHGRSPMIQEATFIKLLSEAKDRTTIFPDPHGQQMEDMAAGRHPVLVISGDRDIACPVDNWFEVSTFWQSLHIVTVPQAGHAPQHQAPEYAAEVIASFVKRIR